MIRSIYTLGIYNVFIPLLIEVYMVIVIGGFTKH